MSSSDSASGGHGSGAGAGAGAKNPERVFMHDIATPLAVAIGMLDLAIDDSTSGVSVIPDAAFKRLEKAQTALLKLQEMMSARRLALIDDGS